MRHHGDTASRDPLGLSPEAGELSREPVPAPGIPFQGKSASSRGRDEHVTVDYFPQAYVDLVKAWGWKSFTIIYESNEGLVRLQELLKAHGPTEFPISVRQLSEGDDYR